jgi:hypothetical protein
MSYLLLLLLLAGSGSAAFFGRPFSGTLRIASRAGMSRYCDFLSFLAAKNKRALHVSKAIPRISWKTISTSKPVSKYVHDRDCAEYADNCCRKVQNPDNDRRLFASLFHGMNNLIQPLKKRFFIHLYTINLFLLVFKGYFAAAFFGRPGGGASLMASYASIGYNASLLMGLMSFLCKSNFIAFAVFPSLSAISATVRNSLPLIIIIYIIVSFRKNNYWCRFTSHLLRKIKIILQKRHQKFLFLLINRNQWCIFIHR